MNIKNKIIVITGASQGLGKQLAITLSKQGASLALIARSEAKLKKIKQFLQTSKNMVEYFVCDVTDFTQVESTVKQIIKKFKNIDILINNAGIWLQGPTDKQQPEKIKSVYLTNSVAPVFLTQSFLPTLKRRPQASILNIISTAGTHPSDQWGIYTSSKYATRGFTDSLKLELKDTNIKVMGFYPGGMNTNLFVNSGRNETNAPWMMDTKDIANIILFMLTQPKDVHIDHLEVKKFFAK